MKYNPLTMFEVVDDPFGTGKEAHMLKCLLTVVFCMCVNTRACSVI